ncbi:MAG: GDSL-type esterase/lipase family protein [Chthoniobacterales bacterium]
MKTLVTSIVAIGLIALMPGASAFPIKRILVFGDSLSDGYGLKRSQAYPALLAAKLDTAGLPYQVINSSATGDTTDSGLRRLPPHLKRKLDIRREQRIDVFILELGINDAFRGVSIDEIRKNLQAIIDRVKARNPSVRIIICGMQLPNYAAGDYVSAFGRMYVDLAVKNHAVLLPYLLEGVAGDPLLNLPDHIHPNADGQKVLAENVWRVLEPIAREAAGPGTVPSH